MFYYAGYAMQVAGGRNFLLPVGSHIDSETEAAFEAVDLNRLLSTMETAGNRINIVVLEAGQSYPLGEKLGSATGLARVEPSQGLFVAFSTSPGTVIDGREPGEGTSLYTQMLLKSMGIPGRILPDVFRTARAMVTGSSSDQVPWFSSSSSEDFVFRPWRSLAGYDAGRGVQEQKMAMSVARIGCSRQHRRGRLRRRPGSSDWWGGDRGCRSMTPYDR